MQRDVSYHCIHGHEYTKENTYIHPSSGFRACRTCNRLSSARRRRQQPKPAPVPRQAYNATHCLAGHELTEENTYRNPNRTTRQCRQCRREKAAARSKGQYMIPTRDDALDPLDRLVRDRGDTTWMLDGHCAGTDQPDIFYTPAQSSGYLEHPDIAQAKAYCARCPVKAQCLTFALENNETFGVWGGLTAPERDILRHPRP